MPDQDIFIDSDVLKSIKQQLYESSELKKLIAEELSEKIAEAAIMITNCIKSGGKAIFFGNGGSAADAQHLACELVGRFKMERNAFPAISLTTNTSVITAISNDYGYHAVFARQIEAYAGKEDVIIGISTSGNSINVIEGMRKAKQVGAKIIGLAGGDGGKMAKAADIVLTVPSSDTPRIQEGHITIGHIICDIVETSLTTDCSVSSKRSQQ